MATDPKKPEPGKPTPTPQPTPQPTPRPVPPSPDEPQEDPAKLNLQKAERQTYEGYPRTSGAPEIFAMEEVPSQKADKEAALRHADKHKASRLKRAEAGIPQTPEVAPEQMHSMTRREMQVNGISDEVLVVADELGIDRYDLMGDESIATEISEVQDDLRVAGTRSESEGTAKKEAVKSRGQHEAIKVGRLNRPVEPGFADSPAAEAYDRLEAVAARTRDKRAAKN